MVLVWGVRISPPGYVFELMHEETVAQGGCVKVWGRVERENILNLTR